jgi:hypothetical protein
MDAWHWAQAALPTKVVESAEVDLLDEFPVCAEKEAAEKKTSAITSVLHRILECAEIRCEERRIATDFPIIFQSVFSRQRSAGIKTINIKIQTMGNSFCLSSHSVVK